MMIDEHPRTSFYIFRIWHHTIPVEIINHHSRKRTPQSVLDKAKMLHEIHTNSSYEPLGYDPLGFDEVTLEYDFNTPELAVHIVATAGIPRTINVEEEEDGDDILVEAWSKGEAQPLAYRDTKFAFHFGSILLS